MKIVRAHPVTAFILLAFGFSYGLGMAAQWVAALLGWQPDGLLQNAVLLFFVVSGPALAAATVERSTGGKGAVRAWLASDWKRTCPRWWWALIPGATLLATTLSYAAAGVPVTILRQALSDQWLLLASLYGLHILMVGLLEELGWRGWLLRKKLETGTPLMATLFVALVWGLWHLPRLLSGGWTAALFGAAIIVNAFLLTALWGRFRGGVALAAIAHGSFNAPLFFFDDRLAGAYAVPGFACTTLAYAVLALTVIAFTFRWWRVRG